MTVDEMLGILEWHVVKGNGKSNVVARRPIDGDYQEIEESDIEVVGDELRIL